MEMVTRAWRCVVLSMLTAMQCGIDAGPGPNELAAAWPVEELAAAGGWLRAGEALEEQNLSDLALEAFLVAARLAPALPIPHERMGAILEMQYGDPDGAAPHYERAIRRGSVHARSHYLLGNFAASQGKHARAATLHRAAVEIDQDFFEAHNNLGTALINLANLANQTRNREVRDYFRSALDSLAAAIALQPSHDVPLRTALTLAHKTADFRYWEQHSEIVRQTFAGHLQRGAQLFMPWQSTVYGVTGELLLLNVRTMALDRVGAVRGFRFPTSFLRNEGLPPLPSEMGDGGRTAGRIQIGYLSCSGFQGNTTTSNFVRGLFGWHDDRVFETHCLLRGAEPFPGGVDGSDAQAQIMDECEHVHQWQHLEIGQVAARITNLKISILVDLTGWTLFPCTEILAMQPAPIQAQWHGYPGSMGASFVHYMGTDPTTTPPEHVELYDERLWMVHGSYMLNHHRESRFEALQMTPADGQCLNQGPVTREGLGAYLRQHGAGLFYFDAEGFNKTLEGFAKDDVVLCCWNTVLKADPRTLHSWIRTLHSVPRARLWLMQFDPTAPPNLALLAAESGVDPQRIAWSTFFSKDIEFLVKGLADIFLDTPNFNAHTTGVDALWSNTPILTTPGGEFSARVAAGLVTAVSPLQRNMTITRNSDDYQDTMMALATSESQRRLLRADLDAARRALTPVSRGSPAVDATTGILFDGARWVRSWESALRRAVEIEILSLPPMHLTPGPVLL